jgi:hypothetical protein
MTSVLLSLLPLALLVGTLLAGRYPGERTLAARLRGARHRPRRRPFAAAGRPLRRPFAAAPRGGRLVGAAIASRPPPVTLT